ncbi:MAG: FAD-dependent oxidoreductase [Deltaproteobacteria bacterium]
MSQNNTAGEKQGIELQKRSYEPAKYRIMCDPNVATVPFDIILDEDKCIGCAVCMRQCPSQILVMTKREKPSECQSPACQYNCPAGVDIRTYVRRLSEGGTLEEAWQTITKTNPFPAVTGRVCPHPCEKGCNRFYFDGDAVSINCLERAVGDYGIENNLRFAKPGKNLKEKIAVIGSGPSGMSAAYQLAKRGYQVSLFETNSQAGGMLRYAIPSYRLPISVVEKEIGRIVEMGVQFRPNCTVGKDITLAELKNQFDAVYISTGAQLPVSAGISGDGVCDGLEMLRLIKEGKDPNVGKRVLVIGGGNTAIDAARSAIRKRSSVNILYRRTKAEMPALAEEVQAAIEEGVKIEFLCAPVEVLKKGNNQFLVCRKMKLDGPDTSGRPRPVAIEGSDFEVAFDTLITATGQIINVRGFENLADKSGLIVADQSGKTALDKVYAGGDAVTGPSYVSNAIGAGTRAALAIHNRLQGIQAREKKKIEISYRGIPLEGTRHLEDKENLPRNEKQILPVEMRLNCINAEEVRPFRLEQVVAESKRCIGCGLYKSTYDTIRNNTYFGRVCLACHACTPVCPQKAIFMPHFYRVDQGRWATAFDTPVDPKDGYPNPLGLPHPVPIDEIRDQITETERVIYRRRSTRLFKTEPLPRETIERVLEAARFAPTAGNCIGVKFVVITDKKLMSELSEATANFLGLFPKLYAGKSMLRNLLKKLLCIMLPNATDPRPMAAIAGLVSPQFNIKNGPMNVFFNAPCAIMVVPHALHVSDKEVAMGIITQNMVLAAHSLGLATCYVGLAVNTINKDPRAKRRFREVLELEWPHDKPAMFLLLGHPAVQVDGEVTREFIPVTWIGEYGK